MFSKSQFQTLFAYHWHTTQHLITHAASLSEADYTDNPGYGHGSIHDLLFHLLRTDRGWRSALETGQQSAPLSSALFPTLTAIRTGFTEEQAVWQTHLDKLSATEIEGSVNLITARGQTVSFPYWRILQHLILHGMQHHTELAQLLTAKGHSPGDIDFIFFD